MRMTTVMNLLNRFFLARSTTLSLIGLAVAAMVIGGLVPQSLLVSPNELSDWCSAHPTLAAITERFGLHAIFSQPLFALLLVLIAISLSLSCLQQFKAAWRRTFHLAELHDGQIVATSCNLEQIEERLRFLGYISVAGGTAHHFARQRLGHWGSFLLHLGMLVVIVSALYSALTQQRGVVYLAEQESFLPGQRWYASEKGVLAQEFSLPGAVRLESVNFRHGTSFGLEELRSQVSFVNEDQTTETDDVKVNSLLHHRGIRVYQTLEFGNAFYLEIARGNAAEAAKGRSVQLASSGGRVASARQRGDAPSAKTVYQLLLSYPDRPEKPTYQDYPDLPEPGTLLRLKYFADRNRRSFAGEPVLMLRLDQRGRELGRLTLDAGGEGSISGYKVRLLRVDRWAGLIFVKINGIPGVFAGFFILVLGAALNYFACPRQITARQGEGGEWLVSWKPSRFAEFYDDEFENLKVMLSGEEHDG